MLTAREGEALHRFRTAAVAFADNKRYSSGARMRRILDSRQSAQSDVELVWAAFAVLAGPATRRTPEFLELDAAFEALFRECTGAIGPSVKLWGSSTGYEYLSNPGRKASTGRPRGRPPKVREPEHAYA